MNRNAKNSEQRQFLRNLLREAFSVEVRNLFYIVTALVVVGTVFYRLVEDWRWIDSLYFSVMTLTTVGYGDLAPATDIGKLFTTIYIFSGLGVVFTFLQTLAREQVKDPFFNRLLNHLKNDDEA